MAAGTQGKSVTANLYTPAVALEFFKVAGKPEKIAQGKVIFAENDKARPYLFMRDKMYLLLEGEVDLVAGRKVIGTIAKGGIFGEMASITHAPRTASAVAKTACRVISLDDQQFHDGLRKKPAFALMLMSMMIGRLRETISRLRANDSLPAAAALKESAVFDPKRLAELAEGLSATSRSISTAARPSSRKARPACACMPCSRVTPRFRSAAIPTSGSGRAVCSANSR